jgi:acyl carrier protein
MANVIQEDVGRVLQDIFADLEDDLGLGDLTLSAETKLIDLGLESISLVYLISELQQHYGLGDRLFRQMREHQLLLKDMRVGEIQDMVVALASTDAA